MVDPVPDDAVLSVPSSDVVLDADHTISVSFKVDVISGAQHLRVASETGLRALTPCRWLGAAASTGAPPGRCERISRRGEHASHHMALPPQHGAAADRLRQVQLLCAWVQLLSPPLEVAPAIKGRVRDFSPVNKLSKPSGMAFSSAYFFVAVADGVLRCVCVTCVRVCLASCGSGERSLAVWCGCSIRLQSHS